MLNKHRDSKLRLGELLPVSVAFKTSHTALEADCPDNSGTIQEVPFTKSTLESHSLLMATAGAEHSGHKHPVSRSGSV